ncbi:MAG: AMP-binding protein [Chromatiales bacterium]|jgi:fatty-acyl-CoA synthase|nr:AMP-binding protein [Chromatiales bacterium]
MTEKNRNLSTLVLGAGGQIVDGEQRHDAAALAHQVGAVAAGLANLGIGRGDAVALWLPNVTAWIVVHLAAARLGALTVCVNTRFRSSEVDDLIVRSKAQVLVYWPGFLGIDFDAILGQVSDEALAQLTSVVAYGEVDAPPPPSAVRGRPCVPYGSLLASTVDDSLPMGGPDDPCIIFTTSGTTGKPKLAMHRQRSISAHVQAIGEPFHYAEPDASLLQAVPLCGAFGHAQALGALAAGASVVMMSAFAAAEAVRLVEAERITVMNGADIMFEEMWDCAAPGQLDTLRGGGFAAFTTPDTDAFLARAEAAGLELFGLYGMSEVQALFSRQRPGASIESRGRGGGYPISDEAGFRICDPDTGDEVPVGDSGELQLRGPSVFSEYLHNPEATTAVFTADGFMRTGDLARDEGDGAFTYLARMGDSLRLGGFMVGPSEIEAHVERHPSVGVCQVVGVPGARGTLPVAFVTASPGSTVDEAELRALCSRQLARYKVPVRFFELDKFPITESANGEKIQRVRLREMALERVAD